MKHIENEKLLDIDFRINVIAGDASIGLNTSTRIIYHRIFILEYAKSTVTIDCETFSLNPNQVLLISKGQIVSFAKDSKLKGYEIIFTDFFWEKAPQSASNCKSVLFDQKSENHTLPLQKQELLDLKLLLNILYVDFLKPHFTNKIDALAAYMKVVMIKIANINYSLKERYSSYNKNIYLEFQKLVSLEYNETREVSYYAERLHITSKQLYESCYRQAGLSPKKIISSKVLEEAKRLLQFSSMPIKEIALTMNFRSNEQFSHFFKKDIGLSPQNYRKAKGNFDI